jgi:arginyl-tRNA synthetase
MQKALAQAVAEAAALATRDGRLPAAAVEALANIGDGHVEVPRDEGHGDLASTAALRLAGSCRMAPRRIAEEIQAGLRVAALGVERTEIVGAGFLNFHLSSRWLNPTVATILSEGPDYGTSRIGADLPVQVEFVSANPTGPLGVVNARAAAVGDTLVSLLRATGFAVRREYYINDAGSQIERLGLSVEARWLELRGQEATIPEGGYLGEYIVDIARAYEEAHGERARTLAPPERALDMGRFATSMMVASHRTRLSEFGVNFDVWYSQETHIDEKVSAETLTQLEAGGHVYRQDGAVWLRTTALGDDKDRVLVKSDGRSTYFLADIAYHRDKFARGFKHIIDIWGPDHHGHIRRMKAAVVALGFPPEALEVLIVQWVQLMEGGQLARMSKRRGQIVPMEDLINEVGVDAARFFFLLRSHDSHMDFDLDLAKLKTTDNPVYYVQYAHARISGILRQPEAQSVLFGPTAPAPGVVGSGLPSPATGVPVSAGLQEALLRLGEPTELALIRQLADFAEEVAGAALAREPHRLPRYALEVAAAFHKFYDTCRVLTDEPSLRLGRLALVAATRVVLANTLELCGVSAPERM